MTRKGHKRSEEFKRKVSETLKRKGIMPENARTRTAPPNLAALHEKNRLAAGKEKRLPDKPSEKVCTTCDRSLPKTEFERTYERSSDGLISSCRDCMRARRAVQGAVRDGKLQRGPCQQCGEAKTDAHHANGYDKENRLNVIWLCRQHHYDIHHPN